MTIEVTYQSSTHEIPVVWRDEVGGLIYCKHINQSLHEYETPYNDFSGLNFWTTTQLECDDCHSYYVAGEDWSYDHE